MTALDDAVTAWEAWDQACTSPDLRRRGNDETRLRVLGVRVDQLIAALKALADEHGLDWHQLQRDTTTLRRTERIHAREALTRACGITTAAAA